MIFVSTKEITIRNKNMVESKNLLTLLNLTNDSKANNAISEVLDAVIIINVNKISLKIEKKYVV